jgi:NADH:ubiquinone oxidoreductase subunit 5 (subunit L)/multisubunit Na+/H+ antiporter MnhA subunit
MMFPLYILAIGALLSGFYLAQHERLAEFLGSSPSFVMASEKAKPVVKGEYNPIPFGQEESRSKDVVESEHGLHHTFQILSSVIALAGIGLAYQFHLRNREAADRLTPAFATVLDNKYWVDEIYQAAIVEPLRNLGRVFFAIDRFIVDGIVGAIAFVPQLGGFALKLSVQRGYLQGYAAAMLFGIAAILLVIFL